MPGLKPMKAAAELAPIRAAGDGLRIERATASADSSEATAAVASAKGHAILPMPCVMRVTACAAKQATNIRISPSRRDTCVAARAASDGKGGAQASSSKAIEAVPAIGQTPILPVSAVHGDSLTFSLGSTNG